VRQVQIEPAARRAAVCREVDEAALVDRDGPLQLQTELQARAYDLAPVRSGALALSG
jgi:hypothetical protein